MDKLIFTLLMLFSVTVNARYRIVDLGDLGGGFAIASAINNNGEIVGTSSNGKGSFESFIYSRETGIRGLGTLGALGGFPESINDNGEVVGSMDFSENEQAFLFKKESGMELLDLLDDYTHSVAYSINSKGYIVGEISDSYQTPQPFLYIPGQGMKILEGLEGSDGVAVDINSKGQIVGNGIDPAGNRKVFIYDENTGFKWLNGLVGNSFIAYEINSKSQIVGASQNNAGYFVAFLYEENTGMIALGTTGGSESRAFAINVNEQIVGSSQNRFDEKEAFLSLLSRKIIKQIQLVSI